MQSLKSKSSIFVERWASAEQGQKKLGYAVIALSVIVVLLTFSLLRMVLQPRPIFCVPGLVQTSVVVPASGAMVANTFAVSWLLNWNNFTPATVEETYARARKFMSPGLWSQTHATLDNDVQEAKKNNISSMFSLNQDPLVEQDKGVFLVTLHGQKGVYVGREEIKIQHVIYHLRLRPINPTDLNPYGMMVESINQEAL